MKWLLKMNDILTKINLEQNKQNDKDSYRKYLIKVIDNNGGSISY